MRELTLTVPLSKAMDVEDMLVVSVEFWDPRRRDFNEIVTHKNMVSGGDRLLLGIDWPIPGVCHSDWPAWSAERSRPLTNWLSAPRRQECTHHTRPPHVRTRARTHFPHIARFALG